MRKNVKTAVHLLALLIAAELVVLASFLINKGSSAMGGTDATVAPMIAFDGANAAYPGAVDGSPALLDDEDAAARATGEALSNSEPPSIVFEGTPGPLPEDGALPEGSSPSGSYPAPGDYSGSPFGQEQPLLNYPDDDVWEPSDSGNVPPIDYGQGGYPPPAQDPNPPAPQPTAAPQATQAPTTPPPAQPTPTQPAAQPTATPTATQAAPAPAPGALVAVPVGAAPNLDGTAGDAAWAAAPETLIETAGGMNASATRVSVRSVYSGENIYFLLSWADPTNSFLRNPWERQPDGSWKKLISPDNRGSDENVYTEDKIALLWPINASIEGFSTQGCGVACHAGENPEQKPYGNMYTPGEGQRGDLWEWKSVRNLGQVDDLYLDSTRFSKEYLPAGRKSDPADGGYADNENNKGTAPEYMLPGGGDKTGAPGYILNADKAPFDPKLFSPGDRVPSVLVAPFTGDRGDISAAWRYADGRWTLEIQRKLVTGSGNDVQFDDLSKSYFFGLASFDNTQLRHATQSAATELKFQR